MLEIFEMGRRPLMSEEQIELVCALREKGVSVGSIVHRLDSMGVRVSSGCINYTCAKRGVDIPGPRRKIKAVPTTEESYERNGTLVRRYTEQEDMLLAGLDMTGARLSEMAERLGRSAASINNRLIILARRQAREEDRGLGEERWPG